LNIAILKKNFSELKFELGFGEWVANLIPQKDVQEEPEELGEKI
jgi:hypothetical protein